MEIFQLSVNRILVDLRPYLCCLIDQTLKVLLPLMAATFAIVFVVLSTFRVVYNTKINPSLPSIGKIWQVLSFVRP
jgi:hypothetical protein